MNAEIFVYDKKPKDFSPKVEVAAIYLNVNDKLLLLELGADKQEKGAWGVPAGKLEVDERPVQAAKRELLEETGIGIEAEGSFHPLGKLYIRKPEIDYTYHLFGINLESPPTICLSPEHCSYQWVSRFEAESLPLMNGAKLALDTYFQRSTKKITTFEIKLQPLSNDFKKQIYDGFSRHAIAKIGHDEKFDAVAFIASNEKSSFIGAVVVELFWGALHVKYVYVEDEYRSCGIATKLMEHALSYGRDNQCPFAFVETMSFQALSFYQKMGFELEFTRSGYKHGTSFHYLSKNL